MYAFAICTLFSTVGGEGGCGCWLRGILLRGGGRSGGWFALVWCGLVWSGLEGRGGEGRGGEETVWGWKGWCWFGLVWSGLEGRCEGREGMVRFWGWVGLGWDVELRLGRRGGMVLCVGPGKGGVCELWLIDEGWLRENISLGFSPSKKDVVDFSEHQGELL